VWTCEVGRRVGIRSAIRSFDKQIVLTAYSINAARGGHQGKGVDLKIYNLGRSEVWIADHAGDGSGFSVLEILPRGFEQEKGSGYRDGDDDRDMLPAHR